MRKNRTQKEEQVIIQERIENVIAEEFEKLLEENKKDKLLQLLIDDKIDCLSVKKLRKELEEENDGND